MRTPFEELLSRYGMEESNEAPNPRRPPDRTDDREALFRIGQEPSTHPSRFDRRMLKAHIDLAELTARYEALSEQLDVALQENETPPLSARIVRLLGFRRKARSLQFRKEDRRSASIMTLVDEMADILSMEHQEALVAKESAEALRTATAAEMKRIDRELIRRLRQSAEDKPDLFGDRAEAEEEIARFEGELAEIREAVERLETDLDKARAGNGEAEVECLSEQLAQLLALKEAVLTSQTANGGPPTPLRRRLLAGVPGIDGLRASASLARSSHEALVTLLETMTELEARYRHALTHMLPSFLGAGELVESGGDARARLLDVNRQTRTLLDDNERLATHVARETFELMIDPETAPAVERDLRVSRAELGDLRTRWASERAKLQDSA